MANLIPCNLCSHKNSPMAETCGECNHPIGEDRRKSADLKKSFIIIALILIFGLLYKCGYVQRLLEYLFHI